MASETKHNSKPLVYIILLNWNNAAETLEALYSLRKATYPNFRVVVVDNGSKDDSVLKLKRFQQENIGLHTTIIENKNNLGFAEGNNVGIRHAMQKGADYVMVLNNDTAVEQSFIDKLVAEAEKNEKAGITTGAIFFYDKKDLLWFGGRTNVQWRKMDKAISNELFKRELPADAAPLEISFVTGCCMLLRADALEEVGGFDRRYFLYFEDADLSFRMRKAGWKLCWTPKAKIWHKVSATTLPQTGSAAMNYYNTRNILLLAQKHGPWWVKPYKHLWAAYTGTKQIIKIIIGRNKEISRSILQGIVDYYRRNFGKYEK